MRKVLIFLLIGLGAFFGLVWWFDVEQTGGSFEDFFSDPIGGTQSLFTRLSLWATGLYEQAAGAVGATADPVAMASGIVAGFEGFAPTAYADPPGQTDTYSIGYGHQIVAGDAYDSVPPNNVISEADALNLLSADLGNSVDCVNNAVTVSLAPEQAAALYSLCYNIGCGAFTSSTLLSTLNGGDYDGAAEQFAVWNKAGGVVNNALVSRRAKEQDLFSSATAPAATPGTDTSDTSGDTDV